MKVAGISVEVERKEIKHTHLAVYPPDARVHVSAPKGLDERDIRSYVASKLGWIRDQRRAVLAQPRQGRREYVSGESIYAMGRRYRLAVTEIGAGAATGRAGDLAASGKAQDKRGEGVGRRGGLAARGKAQDSRGEGVEVRGTRLALRVRDGATREQRERLVEGWQRGLLEECIASKLRGWCGKLGRELPLTEIRRMKTKWASCVRVKGKIVFNAALARVPPRCVEYVVVHELTHFEVANHSKAFVKLMDERLPRWRALRDELNGFVGMPIEEKP